MKCLTTLVILKNDAYHAPRIFLISSFPFPFIEGKNAEKKELIRFEHNERGEKVNHFYYYFGLYQERRNVRKTEKDSATPSR